MIKFFLARVLSWAAKISWADFLRIVWAAGSAANQWPKTEDMDATDRDAANAKRAASVTNFIADAFPGAAAWATNLLRELAVAWINKGKA